MSNAILYESTATDFFNQGLGPLTEAKDPKVTEVGNGEFYLELDYPTTGRLFNRLKNGNLIKADAGHELKDQRFEIKRVVKSMKQGYVSVYAEHISNQALDISLPANVTLSGSAQNALQQAQNNGLGTFKPFTMSSDITTTNQTNLSIREFKNLKQALGGVEGSILDTWGGEYKFDNYHISLFKKRGRQANAMIAYGRNLVDLEQEENIMNTFTSVYPYAVWRDDEGAEHIIEGSVIHSEHADKYPHHKVLPVDFTLEVEDDTKPTATRLNQLAAAYIDNNDIGIPEVSIRLTHLDLSKTLDYKEYAEVEKLNVFDEVKIYFADFDINTTAKIVRTVWNVNLERYDEIEVGKVRASLSDRINTIDKQVSKARKEAQDARNVSMVAANGVNMNFFGPDEPTATKVGDRWFMEDGQYTISKVWDGVIWRVVSDPRLSDQNAQLIGEQQTAIEEVKTTADYSYDQLQQTIANSGFTDLDTAFGNVKTLSEQAESNAQAALSSASNAVGLAEGALSSANNAAGLAEDASSLAATLSGQVSDFELTVNGFDQTVNNYEDQVAQFTSDVNGLNSTVASYETQVDEFGNTVGTYATQVSQFENTVNGLNSTVSSYQTEVDGYSAQVSTFENTLNGLNSTVSNYRTDVQGYESQVSTLTNTVDGFNATVESVEGTYSSLSGTVQSLGASIGVVEGQITNRVWQTDIQGAIDGIEIGGRNLLLGTSNTFEDFNFLGYNGRPYQVTQGQVEEVAKGGKYIVSGTFGEVDVSSGAVYLMLSFRTESGSAIRQFSPDASDKLPTGESGETTYVFNVPDLSSNNVGRIEVHLRNDDSTSSSSGTIKEVRMRRGSKDLGWTPAPEDTTELINSVQSEFTQRADSIEATISSIETDLDKKATIEKVNSIESTVDGTVQRITSIETDMDTKASVAQLNEIKSTVDGTVQTIATIQTDLDGKATVTAVNSIKDTVDGTVQSISDIEGNVTTIESTVRGHTTAITNAEGRITTTEQTINGLQDTVSDPVNGLETRVTTLAGAYDLTVSKIATWTETYSVNTENPLPLKDIDGNDLTTDKSYDIVLGVLNTGTVTYFSASLLSNNSSWTLEMHEQNGNSSNHPYIFLNENGYPMVSLYSHTRFYQVRATITEMGSRQKSSMSALYDEINLRVQEGDVYSQLLIDSRNILFDANDRIMLSADKVVIDASEGTFISGAVIENASIDSAKISEIDASQVNVINLDAGNITSGTLDTQLLTVFGGNSGNYMRIQGSHLKARGEHRRTWLGNTETADIRIMIENGYIRARNDTLGQSLYFSDYGISTYSDAEGNNDASGTLRFRDEQYSSGARGLTMHSTLGVVALKSDENRIVIDADDTINLESDKAGIYIKPMQNLVGLNEFRFDAKVNDSGYDTDGVLGFGNFSGESNLGSGIRFSKSGFPIIYATNNNGDGGTGDFYSRFLYGDLRAKNNNVYARVSSSDGQFRVTNEDGYDNGNVTYRDIQARSLLITDIRTNDLGTNFYFGVSTGEFRVTNNLRYNGGDIGYKSVRASNFYQSSSREYKTNINPYNQSALDQLNELTVVEYNLKDDLTNGIYWKNIGFISEDSPVIATMDKKGIDSYKTSALAIKAIQELSTEHEKVVTLASKAYFKAESNEEKIEALEAELKQLKGA